MMITQQSTRTLPGFASARRGALGGLSSRRGQWMQRCAARLRELRPHHDRTVLSALARDLWADVGSFDPEIAAEMEHEAWPADA